MNKNKTLLIVEDSLVNRKILNRILAVEGYNILEATNGMVALDILEKSKSTISLILLDLTMPIMDGYEFLKKMREKGYIDTIPVIVTTGSGYEKDEIRSLECGASDFIAKPYNPEIVRHRVKSLLRLCDNSVLINRLETDSLTGVYNREAFYHYCELEFAKNPDTKYDIICSNIENFKLINSKYGSELGDKLLKYLAEFAMSFFADDAIIGRISGDSFVALIERPEEFSKEHMGKIIDEIHKNSPVTKYVIDFGVYRVENKTMKVAEMCDYAQMALKSIKHKYGEFYALYDGAMSEKILREHQLTDYMEQALSENQFVVYYQPKHDIKKGEIAGAEALVRWIHPELGFISPGEFIPIFEKNGFITKLDIYVWKKVCADIHKWISQGIDIVPISVNASRMDFETNNLTKVILDIVDSYKLPHSIIHFEVTESAYTNNPKQIISDVSLLRSMGFLIEMDDFGSGYSSLNMLSELPIDILKLDMRFIQQINVDNRKNKKNILSFIISLSKWLQLKTVAEGVETQEEVALLRSLGCDYIQGYVYAKPMPISEFEEYFKKNKLIAFDINKEKFIQNNENISLFDKTGVLIVDDGESNTELLSMMLSPYYNVHTANNGLKAYKYIAENHNKISCILLDLLMPVMDGFQLLDKLNENGYLDEIPIIITSEAGTSSELRALQLGAYSFVTKPYNRDIILHHIELAVNEHSFRKMNKESN